VRFAIVVLVAAGLSGCVAMKPEEIRSQPAEVYQSGASVDEIVRCMRTTGADYVQVTPYPGSGAADFEVPTYQMLSMRILYMATAEPAESGSRVSARFSGQNSLSLSEGEFRELLAGCAPPLS